MGKAVKKEKNKKKKSKYLLPVVGIIALLATLAVVTVLLAVVSEHANTNAVTSTAEVSLEKENVLSKELDQRMTEMRAALGYADEMFGIAIDRFDAFEGVTDYYGFLSCKELYYKDTDGNVYDQIGRLLSEVDANVDAVIDSGETAVTDPYYDSVLGTWVIAVSCADTSNKNIVLSAGVYSVSEIYAGYDFSSKYSADTYVVDKDGKLIITMRADTDLSSLESSVVTNLMRADGLDETIESYVDEASSASDRHSVLYGEKNVYLVSGRTLNNNVDWYTVTVLSSDTVDSKNGGLVSQTMILCIIIAICILIVIVAFLVFAGKNKKKQDMTESLDTIANCAAQAKFESEAKRIITTNPNLSFALIYLDITNYKHVLQLYGFGAENKMIVFFSEVIRKTIKRNEYYARLNDGHMIILASYKDRLELSEKIQQLDDKLHNFEPNEGNTYRLHLNGGVYCIDKARYDMTIPDMIDKAAFAQQSIKEGTKQNYAFYDRKSQDALIQVAEVEALMYTALEGREFKLYLQPKYNIKHNRIDGAEALVRWERPGAGVILPDVFIPVFEKNRFITKIDRFMLEETCKLIAKMTKEGQRALKVSVNVSRVSAEEDDFLEYYVNMKKKYRIADGFIELEFTESMALESYEFLSRNIEVLRKNGFQTSIDDFGQGYSSFKALKALHFDVMKLDKFFLIPGDDTARDEKLLTGVIDLAHSLGMKTIMEGVETQEMLNFLRHIDCDAIQGFVYARPMTTDNFKEFVEQAYQKKVKRGPLGESLGFEEEVL